MWIICLAWFKSKAKPDFVQIKLYFRMLSVAVVTGTQRAELYFIGRGGGGGGGGGGGEWVLLFFFFFFF